MRTRTARVLAVAIAVVVVLAVVTTLTGLPGPGVLRRYPYSDLRDLADRANAEMDNPLTCVPPPGQPAAQRPDHAAAAVDLMHSRVWVPDSFAIKASGSDIRLEDWEKFEGISRIEVRGVNCQ